MKTLRNLFLACAGLLVCACNNDNEPQLPEGKGAVTVKIVNPLTRTELDASDATTVADGNVTVTLYYKDGGTITKHSSVTVNTATETVAKFWDVTNPYLVTASIHGGLAPTTSEALEGKGTYGNIENYQIIPSGEVPAYGETTEFTKTTTSETKPLTNDIYQMYTASLEMNVPFARLEFTIKRDNEDSGFTTLDLGGVYLDNLYLTGADALTANKENCSDLKHPNDISLSGFETTATGINAPLGLYDTAPADFSFTEKNVVAPTNSKVYAYNIFPVSTVDEMPIFKVWFKNASDEPAVLPYQYAIIDTYTGLSGFEAGKIYKINAAALKDKNIIPSESGDDAQFGVNVTVTEASWEVVDATATWQ